MGIQLLVSDPQPVPIDLPRGAVLPAGQQIPASLPVASTHGEAGPVHHLISGENAHVADLLAAQGEAFDLIYLDPPYDTGTQLSYADDLGESWAEFFHARMVRAARLLARPSGVVIIAIDDRRLAWARLIADEVLGSDSFAACVVWDGGVKGQARLVSVSHDYMLIYVADAAWNKRTGVRWREPKAGAGQVAATAMRVWNGDPESARTVMVEWFKSLSPANPARDLYLYCCFDGSGRLYREGPVSKPGGGGYTYDVAHPVTGLPVVPPVTGWRYSPARMKQMLDQDRIVFRADHTSCVATKLFLDEQSEQVATSVFTAKRTRAAKRLASQVGAGQFTYPKDPVVLGRWFALATRSDPRARFLDLFAGSGAAGEAVMAMNAADGGGRTSVCVTINEVAAAAAQHLRSAGYCPGDPEWERAGLVEQVARPRLALAAAEHLQRLMSRELVIGEGDHLIDGTCSAGESAVGPVAA